MDNLLNYLNQHKSKDFNELLFLYIDRCGKKDSEIYKKADIDRKLFSKIRCNNSYIPRKKVIMKLGISLQLGKEDFLKLLQSAGYSLASNNQDLIVSYCIENKIYDLDQVNNYLYTHCHTVL